MTDERRLMAAGMPLEDAISNCCAIRTRTRYSAVVSTSGTGGTFKLLGNACPCPTNNLPSINGTAPAAPAAPGA